jgi:hypothetical protein
VRTGARLPRSRPRSTLAALEVARLSCPPPNEFRAVSHTIPVRLLLPKLLAALLLSSPSRAAAGYIANIAADSLSGEGSAFSSDGRPGAQSANAIPFASRHGGPARELARQRQAPHRRSGSGFTQYSYAFVLAEADELEPTDPRQGALGRGPRQEAHARAVGYCPARLAAAGARGFAAAFEKDRAATL